MIRRRWYRRRKATVDCREVGRVLQSYLDEHVERDFATKIARHLDACRECGLELETYEQIVDSLGRCRPEVDDATVGRLRAFGESLADTPD